MMKKKSPLQELREKKQNLQQQIVEQERLLSFENKKQTLGAITQGFTDKYLRNEPADDGGVKTVVNKGAVAKEIGNGIKDKLLRRNAFAQIINGVMKGDTMENILRTGLVLGMGALAKKRMKSKSWKDKAIGMALVSVAPIALKFAQRKLSDYQQKKSITSLEKII